MLLFEKDRTGSPALRDRRRTRLLHDLQLFGCADQRIPVTIGRVQDLLAIAHPFLAVGFHGSAGTGFIGFKDGMEGSISLLDGTYRFIGMAGLSGGGWTTIVFGALDQCIRLAVAVAGGSRLCSRSVHR